MSTLKRMVFVTNIVIAMLLLLPVFVLGLCLLLFPGIPTQQLLRVIGMAMLAAGALQIYLYFRNLDSIAAPGWRLSASCFMGLCGILIILLPETFAPMLSAIFAVTLFVGGAVKLQIGCNLSRMKMKTWYIPLILSGVSIMLGGFSVAHPFGVGMVFKRMSGIFLIYEALSNSLSIYLYRK